MERTHKKSDSFIFTLKLLFDVVYLGDHGDVKFTCRSCSYLCDNSVIEGSIHITITWLLRGLF